MGKAQYYTDKIVDIIIRKPPTIVVSSLVFILLVVLLKWQLHPTLNTVYFITGGIIGIYLLDIVDAFIQVSPSPFRSIVFLCIFAVVSLFIVTSSDAVFAQGFVLTIFLFLLFLQWKEWQDQSNLNSWYAMVNLTVTPANQQRIFWLFILFFILESFIFIG